VLASFRAELLILRKWPVVWLLVLLPPTYTLVLDYVVQYVVYLTADTGSLSDLGPAELHLAALLPNQFVINAVNGFGFTGTAPLVVLGAFVAGGDWGRGTINTSLSQGPSRLQTFAGQALAVAATLALGVAITFASTAAASVLVGLREAGVAPAPEAAFPPASVVLRGFGVALLISVAYGAAGLALGTLFRGTGAAVAAALVWTVVLQGLIDNLALQVGGVFYVVNNSLPNANAITLLDLFGSPGGGYDVPMYMRTNPGIAAWVLVGYTVAFLVLGAILIQRRNVT